MKLFFFVVCIFFSYQVYSGVIETRYFNQMFASDSGKDIKVCWWGLNHFSPESIQLTKKIEMHVLENIRAASGLAIQFNSNWPACEDMSKEESLKYVGLVVYDETSIYKTPLHENFFPAEEFLFEAQMASKEAKPNLGHPRAFSNPWRLRLVAWDAVLSFNFMEVNEGLIKQSQGLSVSGKENLIKSIALHEILHVLGVLHEHVHPKSSCLITEDPPLIGSLSDNLLYFSPSYDVDSIMNYCLTKTHDYEKSALNLSIIDKESLIEVFSDLTKYPPKIGNN